MYRSSPVSNRKTFYVVEEQNKKAAVSKAASHTGQKSMCFPVCFLFQNGIESLAETLRQTAETAVEDSGYVMDMESGMYYDYKSGYYYDPVSMWATIPCRLFLLPSFEQFKISHSLSLPSTLVHEFWIPGKFLIC